MSSPASSCARIDGERGVVLGLRQELRRHAPQLGGPDARRELVAQPVAVDQPVRLGQAADDHRGQRRERGGHRGLQVRRWPRCPGGRARTCGRDCHSAHSALTSPAVRSSSGRCSCSSRSREVSAACTVTFMAARTVPVPSRTGTATERTPGRQLLVGQRPPAGPHLGELGAQLLRRAADVGRQPGPAGLGEGGVQVVRGEGGQQHLALRGLDGREARADVDPQRDQLGHRDPGDVDDVAAVELRHRRGLARPRDQRLEVRPGDVPEPERGDVGGAQGQHLRGQLEHPADERTKPSSSRVSSSRRAVGRARPAAVATSVSDMPPVVGVEAGEDVEAARQRLDEVRPRAPPGHARSSRSQRPRTRSSPPARFPSST